MATVHTQSFCIIHPDSEFDDPKFNFSDSQVGLEAPQGDPFGGTRSCASTSASSSSYRTDTVTFDRVFAPKTSQEKIFQVIAKVPVLNALENFESAAFIALGATGSGKTFAVTGGAKRFADRGLIPRGISALFEALCARPDREEVEVSVSFYELYKDGIVDLLSEKRRRVALQPGKDGPLLVGLLRQAVATESDAYHLLFQGDSNRHFERMPLNPETSRGHVFYVLHLSHLQTGRKATLSFADLAAVVSTRNQATTAIAQSLDALKGTVEAMHAGHAPPFETSALTHLLQPWLRPNPGSEPVHVALISPVRYTDQTHREVHEWLLFSRLFQAALCDQPLPPEHGGKSLPAADGWLGAADQERCRQLEGQHGINDRAEQQAALHERAKPASRPAQSLLPLLQQPEVPCSLSATQLPSQEDDMLRRDSETTLPGRSCASGSPNASSTLDGASSPWTHGAALPADHREFERHESGVASSVPALGMVPSGALGSGAMPPGPLLLGTSTPGAPPLGGLPPETVPPGMLPSEAPPSGLMASVAQPPGKSSVAAKAQPLATGVSAPSGSHQILQSQQAPAPQGAVPLHGFFSNSTEISEPAGSGGCLQRHPEPVPTSLTSSTLPGAPTPGMPQSGTASPYRLAAGTSASPWPPRSMTPSHMSSAAAPVPASVSAQRPLSPQGGANQTLRSSVPSQPLAGISMAHPASPDASWGGCSRASSRSPSPMNGREAQHMPRANVYAQPARVSVMAPSACAGAQSLSVSQQSGTVPSTSGMFTRPLSPQPHARVAGLPQQPVWSSQQSRSSSPQPSVASRQVPVTCNSAMPRSLSPQPGRLPGRRGGAASPMAGLSYPLSPQRHITSHAHLPSGCKAAPAQHVDGRAGSLSPMRPSHIAGGLPVDRAPTPLRVPRADPSFMLQASYVAPTPLQAAQATQPWQPEWPARWLSPGPGLGR